MLSHVHIGVADFERAFAFYRPVLEILGWRLKFSEPANGWAGWMPAQAERPLLLVGLPYNRSPSSAGNGQMIALLAPDRESVDRCFKTAISLGATNEGVPGLRPNYHKDYYGAYFRDVDGNKLCACCHEPAR
jgi:catechol 2,3-dioxygenase-like lactoylglutathione lyase family enzyme